MTTRPTSPWLILDRFVRCSSWWPYGAEDAAADSHDCTGRSIRASLDVADPPAVSRLYLS